MTAKMAPLTFWRGLLCVLALSLLAAIVVIRLYIGYPSIWNKVQAGMTISQVREMCGPATYSGGMQPETWEEPSLWGRWVLRVGHSEDSQGANALVSTVEVYFDHVFIDSVLVHHRIDPPLQDYDAFYRAFGQTRQQKP